MIALQKANTTGQIRNASIMNYFYLAVVTCYLYLFFTTISLVYHLKPC